MASTFRSLPCRRTWLAIEIGREAATLIMLLGVAMLAGADRWERFLAFCLSFGVWDIFYYAWLWIFVRWPASLFTWDLLFLIPVPWIGPVLAPVLVSVGARGRLAPVATSEGARGKTGFLCAGVDAGRGRWASGSGLVYARFRQRPPAGDARSISLEPVRRWRRSWHLRPRAWRLAAQACVIRYARGAGGLTVAPAWITVDASCRWRWR